jgi:hypothetical protein
LDGASGASVLARTNDPSHASQSKRATRCAAPYFVRQIGLPSSLGMFRQILQPLAQPKGSYPVDDFCFRVGLEDGDLQLLNVIESESSPTEIPDDLLEVRISKRPRRFGVDRG